MTNQLPSLEQRDYFYLDPFSSVNLGTYIITKTTKRYTGDSLKLVEEVTPQILFLDTKPFVISPASYFK